MRYKVLDIVATVAAIWALVVLHDVLLAVVLWTLSEVYSLRARIEATA